LTRIKGALREGLCAFMTISGGILLRVRSVLDKICRENQNTHFIFTKIFFPKIIPFMR